MLVIGMLSGTSYDAVDAGVARLRRDGDDLVMEPLGLVSTPFPARLRERIAACLPPAATTLEEVCRLDTELGRLFGDAARAAADAYPGAELVVSHGQTVYHWVEGGHALGTLQLGSPAWIAEATGLPVVSDLRTRDITRGGHGAPLASTMDALLYLGDDVRRGALNLGGIANITVRDAEGRIIAYDLGPANALIDAAVTAATGGAETMDRDGVRARRGTVDRGLLARLLDEPYYLLAPPKSTGKELFNAAYLADRAPVVTDDVVATVTELTAELVARACRDHGPDELVVAGGGVRNPVLMSRISALAAPARVTTADTYGLPSQAKEAYLFALLGWLTVHGLPGTIPSATGADAPSVLGSITPGASGLPQADPVRPRPRRLRVEPA